MNDDFTLISHETESGTEAFGREVLSGLSASPKRLSCTFLYDVPGSHLFDDICALPEYYLTDAESEILSERAEEILAHFPGRIQMAELGGGNGEKAGILVEEVIRRQEGLHFTTIDISVEMLRASSRSLLEAHPGMEVVAVAGEYEQGFDQLSRSGSPKLILWLGSSVGNFHRDDAAEFIGSIRDLLIPEDRMLLGVDLRKDREVLERAYDDEQGVTAAFNKNLLARINRELDGHFDLDTFRHEARYDEEKGRVEMHLVSERDQTVSIDRLKTRVRFRNGESIHTENSYKYSLPELETLASESRMKILDRWLDSKERFSVNLLGPV